MRSTQKPLIADLKFPRITLFSFSISAVVNTLSFIYIPASNSSVCYLVCLAYFDLDGVQTRGESYLYTNMYKYIQTYMDLQNLKRGSQEKHGTSSYGRLRILCYEPQLSTLR